MLFKEEVYMWFKHSEPHRRVEFVCGILNMCLPIELKFIRTFVENLGKRDEMLKDCEIKTNKLSELKQFGKVLDERTRSKLIIYLALLEANNQTCSKLLYDCLINSLSNCKNDEYLENTSHIDKDRYNKEMQLIFTMMIHHPAFRYEEVKLVSDKLRLLDNYEDKTSDCWNAANPVKMCNNQSPHHLSNLPNETNNVMEPCDSGLSIGTEPEGEILSDHSCVPNQSFPLLMCSTIVPPDKTEEKRKDNLWQSPCPIPPGPVVSMSMPCKTNGAITEPIQLIAQQNMNIVTAQVAVNSSSGESLNMTGVSAVPTAYIYNSSMYERSPLEIPPSSIAAKKEQPNSPRPQGIDTPKPSIAKPVWTGSLSNQSNCPPFVSPMQSSQVPPPKMGTSIMTTSQQSSCYPSSLSSGAMTSVVVSRTITRPAPLPRQLSSSSSGSSHPSSPAMIGGPKTTKYPPPTNRRLANDKPQQNNYVQAVSKDELHTLIAGPLSDTISFIPSIEESNSVSTSQQSVPVVETNDLPVNFQFVSTQSSAKHSESSLTTTVTTTVAVSSALVIGKNFKHSQMSVVSSSMGIGNRSQHLPINDTEKKNGRFESNKVGSRLNTVNGNCSNGSMLSEPLPASAISPFIASSGSGRMPAFTYFPPKAGPPKPMSSIYYASKPNTGRINGKPHGIHRRNTRMDPNDVKQTQMEHSTSSSQYSSPSQTPSPDIKKPDKSDMADNISETGYPNTGSHPFTDNNSPPPLYNQYPCHSNHPRHRYMPFPQQPMGFIPCHNPQGVYRYPMPSPHLMMGTRPPPSVGDKSSRGATPPSLTGTVEGPIKPELSPAPSIYSSVNTNRKSSSASPPGHLPDGPASMAHPNHLGHGPLPFNGPNYQMFPGPFFTHVSGFMPGHGSLGNGFVSQMPPNFSLPPMTEIMYQSPYSMMGTVPQTGSSCGPPYQALLSKPKRSLTCYNCGQVGHMGSDCNESSMVELTKVT